MRIQRSAVNRPTHSRKQDFRGNESQRQDAASSRSNSRFLGNDALRHGGRKFRRPLRGRSFGTGFGPAAFCYFAFLTGSFLEGVSLLVEDSAAGLELSLGFELSSGLGLSSDLLVVLPDFA